MGKYNPYRWYTSNKYRNKPLPNKAPLLLKIRNGDFEYSPFYKEAIDNHNLYDNLYNEYMSTSLITDINERKVEAHQYAKMKRIKAHKLEEKGLEEEESRLRKLREELASEFGKDLWDLALTKKIGKGSTEDLYWWYKNQCKMKMTPSEIAIQLGRNTTKGLK